MCVRRGRASFEKDGSIFKRARAAAACSGAAQAGGGGRRNGESAQFLPQERRGGGRRPHFHPPAIFGGGAFFYLAGPAHIPLLPLFALFAFRNPGTGRSLALRLLHLRALNRIKGFSRYKID